MTPNLSPGTLPQAREAASTTQLSPFAESTDSVLSSPASKTPTR
jgi:hypothetical protein